MSDISNVIYAEMHIYIQTANIEFLSDERKVYLRIYECVNQNSIWSI